MLGFNQQLINILGHAGGALIFAIFLALLFGRRGWSGGEGRYLSALAAGLSLAWNLGSLIVLVCPNLPPPLLNLVVAGSFSFLSLLPAVLLHLSVGRRRSKLVACGYVLSAIAVGMHAWEIRGNSRSLHQAALLLITVGFLILTAAAIAGAAWSSSAPKGSGGTRIATSMCLALFATSFVHFGAGHASQAWSSELVVHHAGIPLALFVLLQDYRFVLLDAFVRFLANALLAAGLTWLVVEASFRLVLVERSARDPLSEALLLMSVCLFLVLFAWLRNRVQTWLTRAVFRQDAVASLAAQLKQGPSFSTEQPYLDWAVSAMAAAVKTSDFGVADLSGLPAGADVYVPRLAAELPSLILERSWNWAEAVVPVRLGQGSKVIFLGRRQGGQRYLGDDLSALGLASAQISDHVESIRRQEMNRLVNQAELRALQSQINPHFLFNALNTLYGTIPREAPAARRMVLNLADVFRYFLQTDKTFVPLSEEMQIVRAYLEVEQLRLGDRLTVEVHVDEAATDVPIPVLSIQPLVENAVKHGVARRAEPGYVRISVTAGEGELRIAVENSVAAGSASGAGSGVGLQNVRRRLEICYGAAELRLSCGKETALAEMRIPMAVAAIR